MSLAGGLLGAVFLSLTPAGISGGYALGATFMSGSGTVGFPTQCIFDRTYATLRGKVAMMHIHLRRIVRG